MEYLEDTQYFGEYTLTDVSSQVMELFSLVMKVINLVRKEGGDQVTIYLIQCMLTFQYIKSQILIFFS